jgi:branched-chain amino acid transport system ATP-binding protein
MASLLVTRELSVTFGGLRAVDALDLAVEEGQIVGLIGPNGAGKTTFIDAITGFVPCSGRIEFDGCDIAGQPAHRRARAGVARTWQSLQLFGDLTVAENLQVAAERPRAPSFLADLVRPARSRQRDAVDEALELLDLSQLADRMPSDLTHGQRKLVGVARTLSARPRLVCMDEPAAGLDTGESEALGRRLRAMAASGTTMLLVDHDMGLVLGVCDHVYVIDFGRLIAKGTPAEIRRDRAVIDAYLGRQAVA